MVNLMKKKIISSETMKRKRNGCSLYKYFIKKIKCIESINYTNPLLSSQSYIFTNIVFIHTIFFEKREI